MRLGELKKIMDKVVSETDRKIAIKASPLYNGGAYRIENYSDIIRALKELKKEKWNSEPSGNLDELISKFEDSGNTIIEVQDYNVLTQYINNINDCFPIFYGTLDTHVEEQDEQTINIKLPDEKDFSLKNLEDLSARLDKLFKILDGGYTFNGFNNR